MPRSKPILLVNDHADLRDSLAAFLAMDGYKIVMAENGQQASSNCGSV